MKRSLYIMALLGLLIACGADYAKKKKMDKKYEWLGTPSAPREYPVEIYSGGLVAKNFTYGFGPIWGTIGRADWGNGGGVMTVGGGPRHLPHELHMTWYSIQEKKFYTGRWALDSEAIAQVWQMGSVDVSTGLEKSFSTFMVGLAPEGKVVLWAYSSIRQIQLASFQARDTVITAEDAREDFAYFFRPSYHEKIFSEAKLYSPDLLSKLHTSGWPSPQVFMDYELQYNWKFAISGLPEHTVKYLFYRNFNGDRERFANNSIYNTAKAKTIPKHVYAAWKDNVGNDWVADLEFDFDQVKDIYAKMGRQGAFDLVLDIDTDSARVRAYARSGMEQIEIPSTESVVVY